MKRLSIVGAIISSFLLGAAMTAVAQEEPKQEEHKNEKQEAAPPRQEPARPEEHKNQEPKQDERQQPQQDERQMKQEQKEQQKMDKQQEKMEKQQGHEEQRHEQAQPQQPMSGGQQARAPHRENQRRISDHDFHAHFGREHRFAPGRMQVYEGRPQFAYSGYMFELVEVWPTGWAYDADDYYIDYFDDEYWLCSFSHPEMRLELIIIG